MGRGILMYETTLGREARRRISEIGRADVVVGIPSHRNGRTIGEVLQAIAEGIATYLPDRRVVLMNADGGSSDNTVRQVAEVPVSPKVQKILVAYQGTIGKGTAIRSVFEVSTELEAKACLVVDARAPGIAPQWIPGLVDPVLRGDDIVFGCYTRSAHAAALTDNLAYPFLCLFLNTDLRDPLASEFCLSGNLAGELAGRDVWETGVARFGVNAWVAIQALTQDWCVSQVDLGYRGEGGGDPGAPLDARFQHPVATLFRLLTVHRRFWESDPTPRHIPFRGERRLDEPVPATDYGDVLVEAMYQGRERFLAQWRRVLLPGTLRRVLELFDQDTEAFAFPADLWARVVLEFALVYNIGEGDPDRVAEGLLPLFDGRAATYVRQTQGLTLGERETVVEELMESFAREKAFFRRKWDRYQSRIEEASRHWLT